MSARLAIPEATVAPLPQYFRVLTTEVDRNARAPELGSNAGGTS